MFTNVRKMLVGTEREAGFTLVELLILILVVGILSAVALPLYLGYAKDAQLLVTTDTPPILNGTITVSGMAGKNTDISSLAFFANASGVTLRCNSGGTTALADSTSGESC